MIGNFRLCRRAATAALLGLLTACSIGPTGTRPPAEYDLGGPPAQEAPADPLGATLLVPDPLAPPWLSGNGIVYRLDYEPAPRLDTYAFSRWAAPPPALLGERLRASLGAAARGVVARGDGVRADYLVRVELRDFSQAFASTAASAVTLRARASVVGLADRRLLAQRDFSIRMPAPTPDAPGAARGLAAASDEFVRELRAWVRQSLTQPKR